MKLLKYLLFCLEYWLNRAQLYLLQIEINDAYKSKNWGRYYSLRMDKIRLIRKTFL